MHHYAITHELKKIAQLAIILLPIIAKFVRLKTKAEPHHMHQKCVTEIPLKPWPALLNHIQRGCVIYMFEVKKNSKQPLTEQIYNQISDSIESNLLVAGTKLPSVRALSNKLGVSTYTISSVYESLVAQNKIEAKKGCGYFILPNRSCTSSHDNYPKDPLVEIDLYNHQISSGYLPLSG